MGRYQTQDGNAEGSDPPPRGRATPTSPKAIPGSTRCAPVGFVRDTSLGRVDLGATHPPLALEVAIGGDAMRDGQRYLEPGPNVAR